MSLAITNEKIAYPNRFCDIPFVPRIGSVDNLGHNRYGPPPARMLRKARMRGSEAVNNAEANRD
jgi:hypothetical protein